MGDQTMKESRKVVGAAQRQGHWVGGLRGVSGSSSGRAVGGWLGSVSCPTEEITRVCIPQRLKLSEFHAVWSTCI